MAFSRAAKLGMVVVAVLLLSAPAALSLPSLISMPNNDAGGLSYDFHDASCPNLDQMVHDAVKKAKEADVGVVAGLLRLSFHDCFPQGCDASILLLNKFWGELNMPQNHGIRRSAVHLIEDIRKAVHEACGATVSCADILNLATRQAVMQSGVPGYEVPLGRLDSPWPAALKKVQELPGPGFNATELKESLASRGLDTTDLVALSGAHTIGRASCRSFSDRFHENNDGFVRRLRDNCTGNADRLQELDVTTPDTFDNKYYSNLVNGEGVLSSDMALTRDAETGMLVRNFAGNQGWFFSQFGTSMRKVAHLPGAQEANGQIRRYSCFWNNAWGPAGPPAAYLAGEELLKASV
ncbi:cationic peroxidase SPC4 [Brachypodium distachyon]|uniref:Peroxidase n=1 Tax=Brachypodium distachyon TaxID=15368 RepID=I1J3P7_BRADI|nr:cationic peroxidase SPC4 [Brachypodium distachyon]KQJ85455.1 hypothetical protein BRADI_5g27150v3 [Brachypodium distachyon]|eukprot:XP_003579527.1 cationic peroxidase SPC4 [Brachypodium distachyon]